MGDEWLATQEIKGVKQWSVVGELRVGYWRVGEKRFWSRGDARFSSRVEFASQVQRT